MISIRKHQPAFTIVELLIVIVVIGILATITIVAYNGIQNRANETAIQTDLTNLAKKLELARASKGTYPSLAEVQSGILDYSANKSAFVTTGVNGRNLGICMVAGTANERFVLIALAKSGKWFSLSSSGVYQQETTLPWTGSLSTNCPSKGIPTSEEGFWATNAAENGQTNGWYPWVKG